jgi:thiol-disulfide isomerase/thioredoxin
VRRTAAATLTAALAAVLLALAGCSTGSDAVDQNSGGDNGYAAGNGKSETYPAKDRKPAPRVTGTLLGGGSFDLRSLRGKVVVVNYWASWCAPCNAEVPDLEQVYGATAKDGVAFLGVDIRDQKDQALAFVRGRKVTYPSVYDPPGKVALAFRSVPPSTIPATMILDRQGRVAAVIRRSVLASELQPMVARVAAEHS